MNNIWCYFVHRWCYWKLLKIRTVSYLEDIEGKKEEVDYYCNKCNREWTVKRNG